MNQGSQDFGQANTLQPEATQNQAVNHLALPEIPDHLLYPPPTAPSSAQPQAVHQQPLPQPTYLAYPPPQAYTQYVYQQSIPADSKGLRFWRAIYPILLFFGAQFFMGFVVAFVLESISTTSSFSLLDQSTFVWSVLIATGVSVLISTPFLFLFRHMDNKRRKSWGTYQSYESMGVGRGLLSLGIGICMAIFAWSAWMLIGDDAFNAQREFYSTNPFLAVLLLGIIIPFGEELCFRGLFYGRLREWMSPISAGLLSALVFALIHGNAVQGVTAFFYGMALALVYERSKSIWAPFLMHAGINTTVVLMAVIPGIQYASFFGIPAASLLILAGVLILGGIVLAIKLPPVKECATGTVPTAHIMEKQEGHL